MSETSDAAYRAQKMPQGPAADNLGIDTACTTPKPPKRQRLKRDDRLIILALHKLGHSFSRIAQQVSQITGRNVTKRAVQCTIEAGRASPQHKRSGRRPRSRPQQVDAPREPVILTSEDSITGS